MPEDELHNQNITGFIEEILPHVLEGGMIEGTIIHNSEGKVLEKTINIIR